MHTIWALLMAAGSGSRMHSTVKKQFLPLLGKPLLSHTLSAFCSHPLLDNVAVVTSAEDKEEVIAICREFPKVRLITEGGPTRQDSVRCGLRAVRAYSGQSEEAIVLIHDAARPVIRAPLITSCIETVLETGSAACAVPVKDTIKRTDENGYVKETLPREALWSVQTPQAFYLSAILEAHEAALKAGEHGCTDDCAVMERFGSVPVRLIQGSYQNIKITTPEDMLLAAQYLEVQYDTPSL